MNSFRNLFAATVAMTVISAGCSCEPIISPPDGGGGGAAGGMAGGAAGGMAGGAAGGTAGGAAVPTQFTQFARDLINTRTTETALPADAGEFMPLPDDAPVVYPPSFFDGGL